MKEDDHLSDGECVGHHLNVDLALAGWQIIGGSRAYQLTGATQDRPALDQHFGFNEHPGNIGAAQRAHSESGAK